MGDVLLCLHLVAHDSLKANGFNAIDVLKMTKKSNRAHIFFLFDRSCHEPREVETAWIEPIVTLSLKYKFKYETMV